MQLYKIITRQGKKHFYESKKSYEKGLLYHVRYLIAVRSYMEYLTIECYKIDVLNVNAADHDVYWREIDKYEVLEGEVIDLKTGKIVNL